MDQRDADQLNTQVANAENNATKQLATDEDPNATGRPPPKGPAMMQAGGGPDYGPQDNAGTATTKTDDTSASNPTGKHYKPGEGPDTNTTVDPNVPTSNPWASLSTPSSSPSSTGADNGGSGGPAPNAPPPAPPSSTPGGRAPPVMNAAGLANQQAAANNTRVTGIVPTTATPPPQQPALTPAAGAQTPAASPAGSTAPGVGIQGLVNGPDLETAIGPAAWASLVGNTDSAQQQANALGSGQAGVQALLQANSGQVDNGGVNSGFDAALINGAGSNGEFQQTANAGKNLDQNVINADQASQDAWKTLQAKEAAAPTYSGTSTDAENAAAAAADAAANGTSAATPTQSASQSFYGLTSDQQNSVVQQMQQQFPLPGTLNTPQLASAAILRAAQDTSPSAAADPANVWGKELGLSPAELADDVGKMSSNEYYMFAMLGVLPSWMQTTQQATGNFGGINDSYGDAVATSDGRETGSSAGNTALDWYDQITKAIGGGEFGGGAAATAIGNQVGGGEVAGANNDETAAANSRAYAATLAALRAQRLKDAEQGA